MRLNVARLTTVIYSHPKQYHCVVELRDRRAAKLVDQIKIKLKSECE